MSVRATQQHGAAAVVPFARAGRLLAEGAPLSEALAAIAEAAAVSAGADVAVARILDRAAGCLAARAVWASSPALSAELEGSRLLVDELPADEIAGVDALPAPLRHAAERLNANAALLVPVRIADEPLGSIELLRAGRPFSDEEATLARLAATQLGIAVRTLVADPGAHDGAVPPALELTGDALTVGADHSRTADQIARLAADATGAAGCLLWLSAGADPTVVAEHGAVIGRAAAREAAEAALRGHRPVALAESGPAGGTLASLRLGEPPLGVLQLYFDEGMSASREGLARLATFGVRAAQALRASERAQKLTEELERTRALLAVVGQAIAQLSLAHTLETAVERVAALLDVERVAVYLRDDDRLVAAAGRALAGPHVRVAERLLELALGPFRGRGGLTLAEASGDERLAPVADALAEAGIEALAALPLLAQGEVIGLLAVYPPRGRALTADESALLSALAAQLAVAVQNARLHEQTKRLGEELEGALTAERDAAKRLRALYEISRSFAQSLSLDATLAAVATTVVELLDVDAAVIRTPDARREYLQPQALHVADSRLADAVRTILERPQPFSSVPVQRLFRTGQPILLDIETASAIGGPHGLLVPFLEAGSTAAVIPIATPAEVLAEMTILSLDTDAPVDETTIDTALAIAGQAALAIDNARLYQQQKHFADTMQRSLLPRHRPRVEGLDVGDVYAPSARLDVGGDLYDFLVLDDGRLAVALGDVTGHGIDATADMAMAKFVFRSLAREHASPSDFLMSANEVVVGEIATGKFITMAYVIVDPATGEFAYASAGHPSARVVRADGTVAPLVALGLPLGIDPGQDYDDMRERLEPDDAIVLYTDGVVEARRGGELFGIERLDAVLEARRDLPAADLAREVLTACRAFGGGELTDDCAIVVLRRT